MTYSYMGALSRAVQFARANAKKCAVLVASFALAFTSVPVTAFASGCNTLILSGPSSVAQNQVTTAFTISGSDNSFVSNCSLASAGAATVTLDDGSANGTFYSDAAGTNVITTIALSNANTSDNPHNATFYYKDATTGARTIKGTASFDTGGASQSLNVLAVHTITASAGAGGTITPSGAVSVSNGSNQAFAIAPSAGNILSDLLVDGVSAGKANAYTFSNVITAHTIAASFNSGWSAPSAVNTVSGSVSGGSNAYTSNDSYAEFDSDTDVIDFRNFNLSVPVGATITGIELAVEGKRDSGGTPRVFSANLSWNNGTSQATAKTNIDLSTSEKTVVVGGASDIWGSHTWVPADFANGAFSVRIDPISATGNLDIDQVQVKVHYTVAPVDTTPPSVTLSTTAGATSNVAAIPVTATFSENVTGFVAGDLSSTNGVISNFVAVNGTTYTFTVTAGAAGNVTVSVPAGRAQDGAGLNNTVSNTLTVKYDQNAFNTGLVSLTFDDGYKSQFQNVSDLGGYKGTFYVNSDVMKGAEICGGVNDPGCYGDYMRTTSVVSLHNSGHEIAAHTRSHLDLATLTLEQLLQEVDGNRLDLLNLGINTKVTNVAYPFGSSDAEVVAKLKSAGFTGGRTVMPDALNNKATDHYALYARQINDTTTVAEVQGWIDEAIANKQWLILVVHEIQASCTGNEYCTAPTTVPAIVSYLSSHEASLDVVTMSQGLALMNGTPVTDGIAPVITQANISTPATSAAGAAVAFSPAVSDNDTNLPATLNAFCVNMAVLEEITVGSGVSYPKTIMSGDTFAIGTTTVTCTAADTGGNLASMSFTIAVTDSAPVIAAHADETAEATSASGAAVSYALPTVADDISSLTAVCAPASGSTFALGTTTVTCNAGPDATGNNAVPTTFSVIVKDTTAPVITVTGSEVMEIPFGSAYVEAGAVASDAVAGSVAATVGGQAVNTAVLGTYVVTYDAVDAAGNVAVQKTRTVTVAIANATVAIEGTAQVYDGTPKAVTVTTTPSGVAHSVTYNGSAAVPTDAGTYPVLATITDTNYTGSASASLVIAKADTTTTIVCTSPVVYTGVAQEPCTATVTGANGLAEAVAIVYADNVNAGTASASATYAGAANYNGSADTETFVIGGAVGDITLSDLTHGYDGTAKAATVTSTYAHSAPVYSGSGYGPTTDAPVAAGDYSVTVAITDPNHEGTATAAFVIAKAPVTVTANSIAKAFGALDPELTYAVEGTLYGTDAFTGVLDRADGEALGSYAITQDTLALTDNYALTFVAGTFTISMDPGNLPPTADSQNVVIDQNESVAITLVANDPELAALTWNVGTPSHGTLTGTAPALIYQPDADYFGTDSFTFSVSEGNGESNTATVSITVHLLPTCGEGFTFNGTQCVADGPVEGCAPNYHLVVEGEEATCVADEATVVTTLVCEEGWTPSGDQCVGPTPPSIPACEIGFHFVEGQCLSDADGTTVGTPPACETPDEAGQCAVAPETEPAEEQTSCSLPGYDVVEGVCVPQVPEQAPSCVGIGTDLGGGMCTPAPVAASCLTGYHQEGPICVADVPVAPTGGGGGGGGGGGSSATYSVRINDNDDETDSRNVTLELRRGRTTATKVWVANDSSFSSGDWQNYASSLSWTLTEGDGVKQVYVRFGTNGEAVLSTKNDSIELVDSDEGEVLGATTGSEETTTGGSCYVFTRNLTVGATGEDVTKLQERLTAEGVYTGPITGFFGPMTKAGVAAYQAKVGVAPQSGYVGPLTLAKLNGSCSTSGATEADAIAKLEAQLAALKAQLAALLGA